MQTLHEQNGYRLEHRPGFACNVFHIVYPDGSDTMAYGIGAKIAYADLSGALLLRGAFVTEDEYRREMGFVPAR